MGKRFTEDTKWRDAWFARLSHIDKLKWLYLCDACDCAGVFDIVAQNDTAALGERIDWDAFILTSEGRVVRLSADKLWLVRFIDFQYPRGLKSTVKAHKPIFRSIERHGLPVASDGSVESCKSPKGVQDTDKETETDKGKDKPPPYDGPLATVFVEWLEYKDDRHEPYAPKGLKHLVGRVRNLESRHGADAVEDAMRRAMANGWKGFDHGIGRGEQPRRTQSQDATERFLARHNNNGNGSTGGVGDQLALRGPRSPGA